jgi:hypothetical protein
MFAKKSFIASEVFGNGDELTDERPATKWSFRGTVTARLVGNWTSEGGRGRLFAAGFRTVDAGDRAVGVTGESRAAAAARSTRDNAAADTAAPGPGLAGSVAAPSCRMNSGLTNIAPAVRRVTVDCV